MIVDLHSHTYPCSPCSVMSAEELIERAILEGLDAICVTDHLYIRGAIEAQRLGEKYHFPVFRGVEARSEIGDVLVFGVYRDIPEGVRWADLKALVERSGGVAFLAHPFRRAGGWTLGYYLGHSGHRPGAPIHQRPELLWLDGIETHNGQHTPEETELAVELALALGKPGIGGSDSHAMSEVGAAVTWFPDSIETDQELVAALRGGNFAPAVRAGSQRWETVHLHQLGVNPNEISETGGS